MLNLKLRAVIGFFLMLGLGGFSAQAETFKVAPQGSYSLDFDTYDGNYSQWVMNDLEGINALRAHVIFARKGAGKWTPMFTFLLENATGDKTARIAFMAAPKSGPLFVNVILGNKGEDVSREMVMTPPAFKEPFDLKIYWTPNGKISFDVYSKANATIAQGFEHHEIDLGETVSKLTISGSTGEVAIEKLELGARTP